MKKIMIIGAGDFQLPLVKKAAESYKVVLVAPSIDNRFEEYAYKKYYYDVRDLDNILRIAQEENISGVITDQTDIPVRTVAYVAEKMGLCGIGYEVSKIFTDKSLMREKLIKANLPHIPYITTDSKDEALKFFTSLGSDVILKPLDTQGSRGVYRISDADGLKRLFDKSKSYSTNKKVIVEKYITGSEVVIEAVTVGGEVKAQICGDTIYFDDKKTFSAKKRIFPSKQSKSIVNKALEFNKKIVEAFALNNGITHGEYIIDGNEVYLIEIAARGGGVFISSDLIHEETGLNTEEFLLDIAMGKAPKLNTENKNVVAGYRAFYLPKGTVESVEGLDEVKAFSFIRHHQFDKIKVGMELNENVNKTSRFAFIIVADNFEQWSEYEKKVIDTLKVTVNDNGKKKEIIWE